MKNLIKKAVLAILMLTVMGTLCANAQGDNNESIAQDNDTVQYCMIKGDTNGDGEVDVSDVATVISVMAGDKTDVLLYVKADSLLLWSETDSIFKTYVPLDKISDNIAECCIIKGDENGDGEISVADIATVIGIMANDKTDTLLIVKADSLLLWSDTYSIYLKYVLADSIIVPDTIPETLHEAVDLGLPSGTLWATMNLGATSPEDDGNYYAWADNVGYEKGSTHTFNWKNYCWMEEGKSQWLKINKYQVYDSQFNACWFDQDNNSWIGDNKAVIEPDDDAAYREWGGEWHIPTYEEFNELLYYCDSEWIDADGVVGRKFTSKYNGNSIFLPAAGYWKGDNIQDETPDDGTITGGYYWSSVIYPTYTAHARFFYFGPDDVRINDGFRSYGQSIRPVKSKQ